MLVPSFFSIILSYFSFLLFALRFYHGNDPLKKYINTYPNDSKSSLLPCSIPICVLIEAYLAVPVRFLFSLYGICFPFFTSSPVQNQLQISYWSFPVPIKKLSGSLCRKCLEGSLISTNQSLTPFLMSTIANIKQIDGPSNSIVTRLQLNRNTLKGYPCLDKLFNCF